MCGIVGGKTRRMNALKQVVSGLEMLEYRGYDSWGIAGLTKNGDLWMDKQVGNIRQRKSSIVPFSELAIGHTRWATHGGVSKQNAHPHTDDKRRFVVVHNGVIENWEALKLSLPDDSVYISDTDTEVIAHLLALLPETMSLSEKLLTVAKKLVGNNAFVVMDKETGQLGAACLGSPLLIGRGNQTAWVVSDVTAFPEKVIEYMPLINGTVTVLINNDWQLFRNQGSVPVSWMPVPTRAKRFKLVKDGQMMITELVEAPKVVTASMNVPLPKIQKWKDSRIWLTGAGTAYHAALWGAHWMRQRGVTAMAFPASESGSWWPIIRSTDKVIAISQSGETRDTLNVLEECLKKSIPTLAIINREHSSMSRVAGTVIMTVAGVEQAVLATKSLISQLVILRRLADLMIPKTRVNWGKISNELKKLVDGRLDLVCQTITPLFMAGKWTAVIGRGSGLPLSMEMALKLKEGAYIPAEGLAGGELKHGSLALIQPGSPCLVMDADEDYRSQLAQNAAEVKARGGILIGFSPVVNAAYDHWIPLPDLGNMTVLASLVAAQYLAYKVAVSRGINPDRPRNLAKSVTVE